MLFPERMCRMDCLVGKEFSERLVHRLHEEGIAEVERLEDDYLSDLSVSRSLPPDRLLEVTELAARVKKAADALEPYGAAEGGLMEDLLGAENPGYRTPIRRLGFQEVVEYTKSALSRVEESIARVQSKHHETELQTSEKKAFIEKYAPFRGLGLDSRHLCESQYLYTAAGLLPEDSLVTFELDMGLAFGRFFLLDNAGERGENLFIAVSVLKEGSQALDEVLRKNRFIRLTLDFTGRLDDALSEAGAVLDRLSEERIALGRSFRDLHSEHYRSLLASLELLEIEKQRCEVFSRFGATGHTSLLRLWVPLKDAGRLEALINAETHGNCEIVKTVDLEEAPVLLQNPGWLRPFESLTKMFSTPKYNQLDPTVILAPTFVLFFGMMMADVAYGALIVLAAFILYRKYGRLSSSARDIGVVLTYFGVSSMLFGMVTGSVLGDFLGKYVLGRPEGSQSVALWLDPLYNGNMLVYIPLVLSIGLLHVLVGYISGAFDYARRGEYRKAFMGYFTMVLLPAGLLLYFLRHSTAGLLVSAVSLVLVFIDSGVMGFYMKVSGMLSSVVSYARLLALMASSSGIAMTVNFITQLSLTVPYVGVVLAALVFTGGHLINIMLNLLGSFVHSLRLHYVEFFGTFYEGGGTEFTPFMETRKHSRLIEMEVR